MRFKAYIVIVEPEDIERDKKNILEYFNNLPNYVKGDDTKKDFINAFNMVTSNIETRVAKFKNGVMLFHMLEYLKSKNSVLGEVTTTGEDKVVNISEVNMKEATRNHILQCGLLDSLLGGLR